MIGFLLYTVFSYQPALCRAGHFARHRLVADIDDRLGGLGAGLADCDGLGAGLGHRLGRSACYTFPTCNSSAAWKASCRPIVVTMAWTEIAQIVALFLGYLPPDHADSARDPAAHAHLPSRQIGRDDLMAPCSFATTSTGIIYVENCRGDLSGRPPKRKIVDRGAGVPPVTQNFLRPAAFFTPSLFMREGAGEWRFAACNANRGERRFVSTLPWARPTAGCARRQSNGD